LCLYTLIPIMNIYYSDEWLSLYPKMDMITIELMGKKRNFHE